MKVSIIFENICTLSAWEGNDYPTETEKVFERTDHYLW